MAFISYAQNLEDVMLWRALRAVPHGCYIDVGASHPDVDSVTRAFYDRGWRGINIEPAAEPFAELKQQRPEDINLNIAVAEHDGVARFYSIANGDGLSTLSPSIAAVHRSQGMGCRETRTQTQTLRSICERFVHTPIHFMKIDVEGAEEDVLLSGDFTRWRPWIVLLEATYPNTQTPTHDRWEHILLEARYRFAWFDGLNRFYVAEEHAASLLPAFAAPPNVFDNYRRAREEEALLAVERHRAEAEGVRTALEAAWLLLDERGQRLKAAEAMNATITRAPAPEIEGLGRQNMELQDRLRDAQEAFVVLATRHAERRIALENTVSQMQRSTSWRITRPMRKLGRYLNGHPQLGSD